VGPLHGMAWAFGSKAVKCDDGDGFQFFLKILWTYLNIKGYHINLFSSFNSFIEKSYDDYAIGRNLCMALRGRLEVKLLCMMMKIEVKKYKSGLWTYKRYQGLSYSLLIVF
jgi:hypothetical protein